MNIYKKLISLFILLSIFAIWSCFTKSNNLVKLTDRSPRISSLGFSFIPPPGENWIEKYEKDTILYIKKTSDGTNSFYTIASEFHAKEPFPSADDFLYFVKGMRIGIGVDPSQRFKNEQYEYKLDPDFAPFCVRYHEKLEDHHTKYLKEKKYLVVENFGLFCLHPLKKDVGIDMCYSERYEEGHENTSLRKEGEEFINSLKFLDIEN